MIGLFLPETVLLAIGGALLVFTLLSGSFAEKALRPFMILASAGLFLVSICALKAAGELFAGAYRIDLLSQVFKAMLAGALFFTVLISGEKSGLSRRRQAEYFLFLVTGTLGMMMLPSAADLLALYVSLELSSYSLYLLSALKLERKNAEAGVKYLVFGAATSGFLLWGLSLIAGLSGGTSFALVAANLQASAAQPAFLLGAVFVTLALLFKLSGFPAHFWAPDVYESASTPVTNFIATASKAAAVAVLVRVFMLLGMPEGFVVMLSAAAFVSMTLGNAVALLQKDLKRLLAYSSIAQAGYILVGLLSGSLEGYSSALFYSLAYLLMNAATFLVAAAVARSSGDDNPQLSHFDGLADRSPLLALVLLLSLLSLAGIPPLAGFTGKWILFSAAMQKGHWFLVLWGVLNSVVSLFYYLTVVKHAYLEKPKVQGALALPLHMKLLGFFFFFALLALGVFPNSFILLARQAIAKSPFFS